MKPNYVLKPAMQTLHITKLRKHQLKPIQSICKGQDTVILAATSAGKSAIYQLPALTQPALTLVVEPTLSLIYAQVTELQTLGVRADYIDHFRSKEDCQSIYKRILAGKLSFLYVTPERLQSERFCEVISATPLYMVVVDECHCVTEWGFTFRESYLRIGDFIDSLTKRPILCACSATVPEERLPVLEKLLRLQKPKLYRSELNRKNLILLKKDVTTGKKSLDARIEARFHAVKQQIRKYHTDGSVIIYALTTGYVDALYNWLSGHFPNDVCRFHAKMKPTEQHKMELSFLRGERKIMIATTAFGMGIHVPDVELVLHFNQPVSMVDYIQQIGRAGRDGRSAHCVLLYDRNGDDEKILHSFCAKERKYAELLKEQCAQMQAFLRSDRCMMQDVLAFLGQPSEKTCKQCTNCAKERRKHA